MPCCMQQLGTKLVKEYLQFRPTFVAGVAQVHLTRHEDTLKKWACALFRNLLRDLWKPLQPCTWIHICWCHMRLYMLQHHWQFYTAPCHLWCHLFGGGGGGDGSGSRGRRIEVVATTAIICFVFYCAAERFSNHLVANMKNGTERASKNLSTCSSKKKPGLMQE